MGFESRGSSVGTGPAEDAGSEGGRGSEVADEDDDDNDDTGLVAGRGLDADDLAVARSLLASTSLWTKLFFLFHRMTTLAVKTMRTQSKGREREKKSGGLHYREITLKGSLTELNY